jgi:hypothetical protein
MDPIFITEMGSLSMGFIVVWIAFFILNRTKDFNTAAFAEIIGVFFGATILNIYTTYLNDQTKFIFWFYPIGLVVGMFAYHFIGGGNIKLRTFAKATESIKTYAIMAIVIGITFAIMLWGLSIAGFLLTENDMIGLDIFFGGVLVIIGVLRYGFFDH